MSPRIAMLTLFIVLASLPRAAQTQETPQDRTPLLERFFASISGDESDASMSRDPLDSEDLATWPDELLPIQRDESEAMRSTADDATEAHPVFAAQPEDAIEATPRRDTFSWPSFDHQAGTPTIHCLPGRVCSVELEPGETVLGRAMGDTDRWLYQELVAGAEDSARTVLTFMPKTFGARTNLLLTTDRRVYTFFLESASLQSVDLDTADVNEPAPLTERARFTYSAAWADVRRLPPRTEPKRQTPSQTQSPETIEGEGIEPTKLDFNYVVHEPLRRGRRFPWRPTVWDDGRFTWVHLPTGLPTLPAIRGLDASDEPYLLNETYHRGASGTTIEIPRRVDEIELFLGTGRQRRSVRVRKGQS